MHPSGGRGGARYRITQGMRILIPPLADVDSSIRNEALLLLPAPAAAAFRALPRPDQSHALRVYRALNADGDADPDLLAAALLHDIGKHPDVGVTQRTARVLLARRHRLLRSIARDRPPFRRWRRGMARLLDHAAIGARIAAQWGCTPATVAIIAASHDAEAPAIVRRLQMVDDRT
jgi:putative nucleotidyltransferase with HDIG domain